MISSIFRTCQQNEYPVNKARSILKRIPPEAIIWLIALVVLAVIDPDRAHLSICPLKNFGFEYCPGCGLGRSISLIFHGQVAASFQMHPLGLFAIIILSYRVIDLLFNALKRKT